MCDNKLCENIWLIGDTVSELNQTKLPLASEVLKLFFYHQRLGRRTIRDAAEKVAIEIESIWNKTTIPVMHFINIILKVETLKDSFEVVKKNRFRRNTTQLDKERIFKADLNMLFDITSRIPNLGLSVELETFLDDQKGLRSLNIDSLQLKARVKPIIPFKKARYSPKKIEVCDFSDSDYSSEEEQEKDDFENSLSAYYKAKINMKQPGILKKVLNSPDVASALDRTKTKDGSFAIIMAAIARACEEDLSKSTLSRSTISRKRCRHRKIIVDEAKKEFFKSLEGTSGLVLHFDGKLLKDYTATNSEDRTLKTERIAVVVSGHKTEQILGVVKGEDGSGAEIAKAAYKMVKEWDQWNNINKVNGVKIANLIRGISFDTTSANTGRLKGACKILEQNYFKRKLLNFACRHHVFEVVIGGVFKKLFGESDGPSPEIFKRFKGHWQKINKKKFMGLPKSCFKKPFAAIQRKNTIDFLLHALSDETTYTPRDDYREVMELCLLVLGHPLPNYVFKKPGANHHARWMAKIIYSFKIYLFRSQFSLTKQETEGFRDLCLFASLIYVKQWIRCPLTSDAPVNDLQFFKELRSYEAINGSVADIAIKKFEKHLWFIGPELVVLSFFSNKITSDEKVSMLEKMKNTKGDWKARGLRLFGITDLHKKSLTDLIDFQSMNAIKSLGLDLDFMSELEPEKWSESVGYKAAKSIVDDISVVNDVAERTLALMTDYNEILTRNEDQKQLAIQVVQDHRKRVKGCQKKYLSTYKKR